MKVVIYLIGKKFKNLTFHFFGFVKFLKEERGIGYRRISRILFDKGYRSVRTNSILKPNYIY